MSSARDEPRVAVVVIGRNEGPRLLRCLDSVWAMDYPQSSLDLIYVDSQSTDDSVDQAKHRNTRVFEVNPERPCASIGRNAGWRATDAEFILFLDGDTVLAPTFVRAALAAFGPDMAVVFGNRREMATDQSVYNRVLDLDWVWPLGELDYCGGDALMRRDALVALDGYEETLIAGEEPDMCGRMRDLDYRILHIDAEMTGHDMDMHTFSQYWRRAMRTGHAYSEVSARFRTRPVNFGQPSPTGTSSTPGCSRSPLSSVVWPRQSREVSSLSLVAQLFGLQWLLGAPNVRDGSNQVWAPERCTRPTRTFSIF